MKWMKKKSKMEPVYANKSQCREMQRTQAQKDEI